MRSSNRCVDVKPVVRAIAIMRSAMRAVAGGVLVWAISTPPVLAQANRSVNPPAVPQVPKTLNVATRVGVPPFVFEENGELKGFSIELWQKISEELGVQYKFARNSNVRDLLNAVKTDKVDVGIAAISITSDREEQFDFSYPMFESGLQIMVLAKSTGSSSPNFLSLFFSPSLLQLFGIMILIVLVPAHIIWFSERGRDGGMEISHSYFPGIFQACWWAAATLATQADSMPKAVVGRIVAVIWMFTSVVFVAYFTATVTTSLTVQQLQSNIKGPDDLPGKVVATTKGSTSAKYLSDRNIQKLEFTNINDAYDSLLKGEADAIVFDSPVLMYYAAHQGKGRVQVVGEVFQKENYGIVFATNSPLRKPVNNALLTLQEKGIYQQLYDKWFRDR
ncbi:transporter substrate-binding domain-containing protein [Pseudanabaena sp. PCC 6802]|uniref:transporter substrate-binding domain-containing protein n=1 Tax=Pseudanabaena sp. PCC 6802 TaxID=118173 RepID=UPI001930AA36|nr:transporter substrate-binding domain-containing protein [Pseudanabaena sp. PCC 6802]